MTNEMMLKRIMEMVDSDCNVDSQAYNRLVEDLRADIRADNNKARGCGNLAKLAKAIFKSAPPQQKMMQYSHIENDVQFILDGYRIAGFYEHIDLPDYEKDAPNTLPPEWFKVSKIIEGVEYDDESPLQLPTVGELKTAIKLERAKSKSRGLRFMWKFENGPAVNAQYLLDFMEGYPDMKIYASANRPMVNPLYIEATKGMGILLPINCSDDVTPGIHRA